MMYENRMVSAIITTYKRRPDMLRMAIESVLNQTYKNIEVLVVDDSPNEYEFRKSVKTLCESYGEKITYIQHKINKGACAARNTGIKASRGEYLAFLDDDDEWLPEKIEKQLAKFDSTKVGIVYCGNNYINNNTRSKFVQERKFIDGAVFDELILGNFIGSTSFPLMSREAVEVAGMFDIEMPAAQDWDLWLRIAQRYEIRFVSEPLVNYYVHEGEQITDNKSKKARAYEIILFKHLLYLKKHPKAYAIRLLCIADFCASDKLGRAYKLWFKAFATYPFIASKLFETCKTIGYFTLHRRKKILE